MSENNKYRIFASRRLSAGAKEFTKKVAIAGDEIIKSITAAPLIPEAHDNLEALIEALDAIRSYDLKHYADDKHAIDGLTLVINNLTPLIENFAKITPLIKQKWETAQENNDEPSAKVQAKNLIHVKKIHTILSNTVKSGKALIEFTELDFAGKAKGVSYTHHGGRSKVREYP